jgi:hypothetical protein
MFEGNKDKAAKLIFKHGFVLMWVCSRLSNKLLIEMLEETDDVPKT